MQIFLILFQAIVAARRGAPLPPRPPLLPRRAAPRPSFRAQRGISSYTHRTWVAA
ncbi:MAG: hypothetical protein LBL94_11895 [Prevotellaceae bacterium]|nr:hypothetical protein [Prevotellaceae bacterium]